MPDTDTRADHPNIVAIATALGERSYARCACGFQIIMDDAEELRAALDEHRHASFMDDEVGPRPWIAYVFSWTGAIVILALAVLVGEIMDRWPR